MSTATENKNKYAALGFTLGFHVLLFLLFIWTVFITPIPAFEVKPVPEIEIGLGMEGMGENAGGSGNNDKDIATTPDASAVTPTPATNDAPNIVTDPTETDVVIKTNPKAKPDVHEEAPKTPQEEKASAELLAALSKIRSKHTHTGEGEGNGKTGGSGDGKGKGVGSGNDDEEGNDPFHHGQGGSGGPDLKGRKLMVKPDHLTDASEEGIVVVEIIVDKNGNVIKATPGQRGSTTFSSNLYAKARQAALTAKFNVSADAKEQRGTYTFVFTLE